MATTDDAAAEENEVFQVSLSVSDTSVKATSAKGVIVDDDAAALTIADASADEGDSLTFTVTLDAAVSGGFTVTPSFTDGTATEGVDYTENTAALTFAGTAGETQTFTVATTEDTASEPDETFAVSLAVSGTEETVRATDIATGTITDDDAAAVTIADASASEGDSITFTVTLDAAVSGGFTVTPGFTDGTATKGTDYTANTAALTFAGTKGETQSFTVATTEDTDSEADETFTVGLTVSGTQASVTATDTATGTITDDDAAAVTIGDASAEEGESMTFTVTLDRAVAGGLIVTPFFTDVTATKKTDYTANTTATLAFAGTAGETKTFTVPTTDDTDPEPDETFTVGLAVSGNRPRVKATDTATGTITDDDAASVTIGDASADEGEAITFTVTLDKAVSGGLTVTPSFTDGTATEGVDYTENTTALTFTGTAGETQTFTVATAEDTEEEEDETFTVGLTVSGTLLHVTATDTATGTITVSQRQGNATPAVTIGDASAEEGEAITFTVTLDKAVSGGLTVTPSFTDGTATKGTDYTENTAGLTFAGTVGETQTFTVATTEDADVEAAETFTVSLGVSGTQATVTATDTATGTILDDDAPAVTIGDASADEGEAITFTVTLDKAVSGGLTVTPSFTDGTATEGTDYTANTTGLAFTGTAGETRTFTVATAEDADQEPDETFTVSLSVSGTQVTVRATDTAAGTILDDDTPPVVTNAPPVITAPGDKTYGQGETVTAFGITVNDADGDDVTVRVTGLPTGLSYASDQVSGTVAADAAVQGYTVTISADDGVNAAVTETFTITVTASVPAVTIGDASAEEGEAITFTVTLDGAVSGGFTVTPSFADGTATEGTDYTENTAGLSFAGTAGETQTFTVATAEDADEEPDETFTVRLSVSGTEEAVTATDTATGTILDDGNGGGTGTTPTVTIGDASASEGEAITFTVTLDGAVSGGFTVTPSFTDGTATEGTDYTENTAGLSFAGTAGEEHTFTVATAEDADQEPDETFTVSLAVSGTEETVTATDTATGTITNNDGHEGTATTGTTPAVTIGDASAEEGEAITFTVTLDGAVSGGFTVTPSFTDGTATEGTDYTENTAGLSFAGTAGETQTFTVATAEDADEEPDETFTVRLSVSGTEEAVTATDTATGTILDDGNGGGTGTTPTVTIGDASASEGEAITFTVTLDGAVSGGFTVTPSFTDGTATEGTDYTENTAGLSFAGTAGEEHTFTVATAEDADQEPDETFTVSLAVSGTEETVTATDTATGTILDDGKGGGGTTGSTTPAVIIADASAEEGEAITFTVTLVKAVSGGLTVTPSFTDGTATEGTDYTENTVGLAFAGTAGEEHTFTVATVEDAGHEPDETFTVSLAVSGTEETVTATDTATGTILDDDDAPAVTIGDASAEEGEVITFTVTLGGAVSGGLTVTPSFADGTATEGTDYTENTAGLAFAGTAGETWTFTVATAEDTDEEPDETFTVRLAVSGTEEAVTATDTATGTILDDDPGPTGTTTDASARLVVRLEPNVVSESAGPTLVTVVAELVGGALEVAVPVTLTAGSSDDTAERDVDYEAFDVLTVTIPAGSSEERETFMLSPIEDDIVEGSEILTVTGESELNVASDRVTIRDEDLVGARAEGTGRTLFLLARAIGSESLAAIEERFATGRSGRRARLGALSTLSSRVEGGWEGLAAGLAPPSAASASGAVGGGAGSRGEAGTRVPSTPGVALGIPAPDRTFGKLGWLDGISFTTPLRQGPAAAERPANTAGDGGGWMLWGRTATTRMAVQAAPGAQANGDIFTMHMGVDTHLGSRVLLGVAVSHNRGKLGYALGSEAGAGPAAVDGGLTSAQPYLHWTPRSGLEVWSLGGLGRGELMTSDTFGTVDTGIDMRLAAGGIRQEATAGGGVAVKADVFHVALESEAQANLPSARATATRGRMLIELASAWAPSPSALVQPRVEMGGRWDGGGDVGGMGAEVGGGLSLVHAGLGMELTGAGRYLLAHQAEGFEEWGASVALRAGSGVTRQGPWISIEPELGAAASQTQALWGTQAGPGLRPGAVVGTQPVRWRLATGYTLPEAGIDLRMDAVRETRDPEAGPSLGLRLSATLEW